MGSAKGSRTQRRTPKKKPIATEKSSDHAASASVTRTPFNSTHPHSPHRTLKSRVYMTVADFYGRPLGPAAPGLIPDDHLEPELFLSQVHLRCRAEPLIEDPVPGSVLPHILQDEVYLIPPLGIVL